MLADCQFSRIELGFLLDGSASVQFYGNNNFEMMKEFMKNLTDTFSVSNNETRVGSIVYSSNTTVAFLLDQFSSFDDIAEAITNITYPGGGTKTGQALNETTRILFNSSTVRSNAAKVLVVLTDGVSTDEVTKPAEAVNESGVTSFVLGIGENYDSSQLDQIALGKRKHVFVSDFSELGAVTSNVREAICLGSDTSSGILWILSQY